MTSAAARTAPIAATGALALNPELDARALGAAFRRDGHVRITRFLGEGAAELYRDLEARADWTQLVNHETGAHELAWSDWAAPGSAARAAIEPEMFERARDGFQYSYAALRVPPPGETSECPRLNAVAGFMTDPAVLDFLSEVTGIASPRFVDGQVTAYGHGDFLTGHDDDLTGSGRKAAFVLGLTPQWRLEWGGLLMFHELGEVDFRGKVPQFNTLDLFAVPVYHSVSMVTRAAPRRRFSVTGWLAE
jgi:Rps23 Pro-64 3,4-dihydroxylase Tpa1-like proline 4-hydroxylase